MNHSRLPKMIALAHCLPLSHCGWKQYPQPMLYSELVRLRGNGAASVASKHVTVLLFSAAGSVAPGTMGTIRVSIKLHIRKA